MMVLHATAERPPLLRAWKTGGARAGALWRRHGKRPTTAVHALRSETTET